MNFTLSKPCIITYRDYKKFNINAFRSKIQSLCSSEVNLGFFKDSIFYIFNKHAPITRKNLRSNEVLFITKELHVAFMRRSRLRNKFLREKNQANRDNYKIQRNLCKKLLRKTNNLYFSNLDTKKITDNTNKTFHKTVILFLTRKPSKSENIITDEGDKSISDENNFAKYLTHYFLMLYPTSIYLILLIILRNRNFTPFQLL